MARLVDICLDAGITLFDSADGYSDGLAEEILRKAIAGRRDKVLISTKGTFRRGTGPNDVGSSRFHLIQAVGKETGKTVPQIAINWLLQRPAVSTIIVGARLGGRACVTSPFGSGATGSGPCGGGSARRIAEA